MAVSFLNAQTDKHAMTNNNAWQIWPVAVPPDIGQSMYGTVLPSAEEACLCSPVCHVLKQEGM